MGSVMRRLFRSLFYPKRDELVRRLHRQTQAAAFAVHPSTLSPKYPRDSQNVREYIILQQVTRALWDYL